MKSTLFIHSPEQLQYALQHMPTDTPREIATTSVDVLAFCKREDLPSVDLTDYLGLDGYECLEQSLDICKLLGTALGDLLPESQKHLAFHMAIDLLYPLAHCLHVHGMVENFLKSGAVQHAVCFGDHQQAFFWDPPNIPPDSANAVIRWTLEQHQIPIKLLSLQHQKCSAENRNAPKDQCCHLDTLIRPSAVLSMVGDAGLGLMEQQELKRSCAFYPQNRLTYYSSALDKYLPFRAVKFTSADVYTILDGLRGSKSIHEALIENSHLIFLWESWARNVKGCLWDFKKGCLLAQALRPKVVLTGYDVSGSRRCLSEGFLMHGVTPVSIMHGGLVRGKYNQFRHFQAVGHLASWCEEDGNLLGESRDNRFRIEPVGSLRSDVHCALSNMSPYRRPYSEHRDGKPCVMFVSSWIGCRLIPRKSPGKHVATWHSILHYCSRRDDLRFLLKRHPRYDYTDLYRMNERPGLGNRLEMIDVPLQESLQNANVVVMVNMTSTAALDAICAGIPVLYLQTTQLGISETWIDEVGFEALASIEELEVRIDEILNNPDKASAIVARMQENLGKFICASGPDAVRRLWTFVERVRPDVWDTSREESESVNNVSLWCLHFSAQVEQITRGLSENAWLHKSASFRANPEEEAACMVDLAGLEEHAYRSAIHSKNRTIPCALLVLKIRRLVPAKYRLSLNQFRVCFSLALVQDASDARWSRSYRIVASISANILAPRRFNRIVQNHFFKLRSIF